MSQGLPHVPLGLLPVPRGPPRVPKATRQESPVLCLPDKSRSEEDVRDMAARNKITQDMLQPRVRRSFSDEEGSLEDLLVLSDEDSESSDIR